MSIIQGGRIQKVNINDIKYTIFDARPFELFLRV